MRKLVAFIFLFCGLIVHGQVVPQGINYQAVALDQQGQPIPGVDIVGRPIDDAEIGVRISILEASPMGNVLYQEEHEVLTDQYGMFNLTIGQGLQVSADPFNTINWQGDKFLQVELSIENDGEFALSAVQQLMSVPYAFLADRALNVDDADSDPTNELQALSISNDTLYLSSGGFVVLPSDQINDADADPTNELQAISMSNDTLYLSSGGFVVLPPDQINDADADPTNEFQTITRNGSTINLSGNGGSVTVFDGDYTNLTNTPTIPSKTSDLVNDSGFLTSEVDGSTTNEIQTLSKSGSTISLSDNGGSVTVFDGDYNNLSNTPSIPTSTSDLTNDSGFLTNVPDSSDTNEIQFISISNDTIFLSQGGFVVLPNNSLEYAVGDTVFGGVIAYILTPSDSGYSPEKQQGIIVSTQDLQNGLKWGCGFFNGSSPYLLDGNNNMSALLSSCPSLPSNSAMGAVEALVLNGYDDWTLPTTKDFEAIYNNASSLTGLFTNNTYWGSTENSGGSGVYNWNLVTGYNATFLKNDTYHKTRPIRYFSFYKDSTQLAGDNSVTNELQLLSISNDTIYLSDGGYVKLPASLGFDGDYNSLTNTPAIPTLTSDLTNDSGFLTSEVDASTTNEIQTLSKSGSTISLSDNGGSVTVFDGDYNNLNNTPTIPTSTSDLINNSGFLTSEVDGSTTNELQVLSISNDTIFLSDGGFIKLPASQGFDGNYNSLTNTPFIPTFISELTNDSGFLTSEVDGSTTNELQVLSISNDTIFLSDGGFIKLPASLGFDGDYNSLTNTPSIPTLTSDLTNDSGFLTSEVDGSTTNEIQTLSKSGSTISLSDNGGSVTVFDGDYNNLSNTPTIPTSTSDLINDSGFITSEQDSSVTNELQTLSISNDTLFISNSNFVVLSSSTNSGNTSNYSNGSYTIDSVKFSPGIKQANVNGRFSPGDTFHYNASILAFDFVYFFGNSTYTSSTCYSPTTSFTFEIIDDKQNIIASISDDSNKGGIYKDCNEQTLNLTGEVYNSSYIYFNLTVTSTTATYPMNVLVSYPKSQLFYLTTDSLSGSVSNSNQTLSISNDTIFLTNGGFIKLPASQGFDGDYNSLTNTPSIPTLTSDLTNDSGFLTSEVDGSTTNEIQTLSKSGSTISLSDNGGSVTVFDGDYNNLSNTPTIPTSTSDLINDSGFLTSEVDSSTTNEIQTISISNDTIFLSNGGYVKLPQSANNPGSNTQGGFYDWIYEAGGQFVGSVNSTNTSDSSRIDLYDKAGYMRLKGDFYSGGSGNYVFDITCVITDDSGNVLYQQNHSNGSGFELNRKLDGSISFITIKLTWNSGNSNGWLRKEYSELLLFEDSATNTASSSSSKANSMIYTINGF